MYGGVESATIRRNALVLGLLLYLLPVRSGRAEARVDLKTLYYIEDSDRMQILSPMLLYENAVTPDLTIKVDAVYNSISGATPTGAPAVALDAASLEGGAGAISGASPTVSDGTLSGASPGTADGVTVTGASPAQGGGDDDGEEDDEDDDEREHRLLPKWRGRYPFQRVSGASPGSTPAPRQRVPVTQAEDTRTGVNIDASRRFGHHTIGTQLSLSNESDYDSYGIALRDGVDFNKRNTTLTVGGGLTHDVISAATMNGAEDKNTVDLMVGLIQVLDARTSLTLNLTLSMADGFLDDPYKVVELNGVLVPEHRPGSKDKRIAYVSLTRFVEAVNGSLETSYRFYNDTFGINAHTFALAWYQRLGQNFVLRPMLRLYHQSEADFYSTRFEGDPQFYSSDYRISSLLSLGYGLKLIWTPTQRFSADVSADRYEQTGLDSVTAAAVYPSSTAITGGVRLWF
jgi:hypothetical protein